MKNIDIIKDSIRNAIIKFSEIIDESNDLFATMSNFRQTLFDLTFEQVAEQVNKDEFSEIFNNLYDGGWLNDELDRQYEEI